MGEKKGIPQRYYCGLYPKERDILNTARSILHRDLMLRGHRDPLLWGRLHSPMNEGLAFEMTQLRTMKYAPEPGVHIWWIVFLLFICQGKVLFSNHVY